MLTGNFVEMATSTPFRDPLHAANLRHVTDGVTTNNNNDNNYDSNNNLVCRRHC